MSASFYWHDYETFGADPSRDRPVQFAGLRTDLELKVVGDPLVMYCKPAADVLPQPEACLVTGITPQLALADGLCEAEFIRQIHAQMSLPGTCGVGYNSLRFDDEVTRYTLYRNFYDPYEREYKNGNSRWDIIDMVRLTHALRPAGIEWPQRDDGLPSFKLEHLAAANGIGHENAHDALSDVEATIAIARLIRGKQPRLFEHVLSLRHKSRVFEALNVGQMKPVLHVSGKFGARRDNISLVAPVALHPSNKSEVICVDLCADPGCLADLTAEEIGDYLFCSREELPEGVERPPLKNIRANRCPIVLTPKLLNPEIAERLGIDVEKSMGHADKLKLMAGLAVKLQQVFLERTFPEVADPDRMLYSGGFFDGSDRRTMARIRAASPQQLQEESFVFEDSRLPEMLFRYRARNFPDSLTAEESSQWEEQRFAYLTDPAAGASISMAAFHKKIGSLQASGAGQADLLEDLLAYSDQLLA